MTGEGQGRRTGKEQGHRTGEEQRQRAGDEQGRRTGEERGPRTGEEREPETHEEQGHGTGEDMQIDTSSGGREIPPQRDFSNGARLVGAADGVGQARAESRGCPSSSLLDCAGEKVRLIHLSPPLDELPSAG